MSGKQTSTRWIIASVLAIVLVFAIVNVTVPLLMHEPDPFAPHEMRRIEPYQLVLERPEQPDEERNEPDDQERQIVSINAPATEEVPDEARFEDRVTRSVEEETAARERGNPGASSTQPSPAEEGRRPRQSRRASHRDQPAEEEPEDNERVAAVLEPTRGDEAARSSSALSPNETSEPEVEEAEEIDLAAFRPTFERASDVISVPGAGSIDHLDLPPGDRDQLNSFENMYWSYWDRLKNQVRPHWRPAMVYRDRDPTGRVFGVEDRYTVLRVTLNGDGSLRHVYLERSSDLDFLDREAIQAIRAAQPFANVPEGLKDERGLLSFRFGFYFEVSSRSFRIRREDW